MELISSVFTFILILGAVLLLFNVIIIVHELGHFLAARWRGLYVDRFQIWFGKPLIKKTVNGVTYGLGSIPAGGFVSVPQMLPMEMIEGKICDEEKEKLRNLPAAKPIDKIIVAAAGPLFSLLLALFFAVFVWWIGYPVTKAEYTTEVGFVAEDGPAAKIGLEPGDTILEVNGKEVTRFFSGLDDSIVWNIVSSNKETVDLTVRKKNGEVVTLEATPEVPEKEGMLERAQFPQIGIMPAETAAVHKVNGESPAGWAGLQEDDIIKEIDGQKIYSKAHAGQIIRKKGDQTLTFLVERKGEEKEIEVTPQIPVKAPENLAGQPMIGIEWATLRWDDMRRPDPLTLVAESGMMVFNTISALIQSKFVKPEHLSGPVGIINIYHTFFTLEKGWKLVLWLTVVINVNLAILNMLPFPVLDGGHIVMALLQMVRGGKQIGMRALEIIQGGFAILLFGFMIFITFYDTAALFPSRGDGGGGGGKKEDPTIEFAKPGESSDQAEETGE